MKIYHAIFVIFLLLSSAFSGCIVNLDSCKIISYSITDRDGYATLSLHTNVSGSVVIELIGTDGSLLDEQKPLEGEHTLLFNLGDYHKIPPAGEYTIKSLDRYGSVISKETIALSTPELSITGIDASWWREIGRYTLIEVSLGVENSGDVPVYIGKIEVGIDGLENSSAYIFDGVVNPDSTATISASIYIPGISSSEHNLSCRVFDTDDKLLTSANFTDTPSYNPYMKRFHYNWNYGGKRFSINLPLPGRLLYLCSSLNRPPIEDYSYYVLFPYDDNYVSMITDKLSSLYKGKNDEDRINFIASLAQSITYETEEGEYPQFPIELLANKSGDCEDKAIFTASILSNLGYDVVLIRLPQHMAVGVHLESSDYDGRVYYEDSEGKKYLFLETSNTGWKLGEAKEEYKNAANHTLYHVIPKPILIEDCDSPVRYTSINRDYVEVNTRVKNIGITDADNVHIEVAFITQYVTKISTESSETFSVDAGSEKQIHFEADCPGTSFKKVTISVVYKGENCFESTFIFE